VGKIEKESSYLDRHSRETTQRRSKETKGRKAEEEIDSAEENGLGK
jgi:hypothetical protein